ncbi:hypothetical protein BAE44_0018279 [Dichanthelium oligosanthes]|uniref:DUF7642 domain-containing protein n=1 Tax=Dichanthelium oligosanthes TaxID=888268 RepID=A0A1E5V6M9_9POAL|nr:hypothetical protein BAE44_0018279 [Dichanthelium oligosanthes]
MAWLGAACVPSARRQQNARARPQNRMGSPDERVQVDALERHLLVGLSSNDYNRSIEDKVLHDASFAEMEDNFVKYQIAQWILLSVVLVLAWGVGLLMLLYLPIRIYVCRRDFQSRKLYLTPDAVVYKVFTRGMGYLQSFFGVYSIRIENVGVRKPPSDDVKITGVAHPNDFRKAVLVHILNTRNQNFSRKAPSDGQQSTSLNPIASNWRDTDSYGLRVLRLEEKVQARERASSWKFDTREA